MVSLQNLMMMSMLTLGGISSGLSAPVASYDRVEVQAKNDGLFGSTRKNLASVLQGSMFWLEGFDSVEPRVSVDYPKRSVFSENAYCCDSTTKESLEVLVDSTERAIQVAAVLTIFLMGFVAGRLSVSPTTQAEPRRSCGMDFEADFDSPIAWDSSTNEDDDCKADLQSATSELWGSHRAHRLYGSILPEPLALGWASFFGTKDTIIHVDTCVFKKSEQDELTTPFSDTSFDVEPNEGELE